MKFLPFAGIAGCTVILCALLAADRAAQADAAENRASGQLQADRALESLGPVPPASVAGTRRDKVGAQLNNLLSRATRVYVRTSHQGGANPAAAKAARHMAGLCNGLEKLREPLATATETELRSARAAISAAREVIEKGEATCDQMGW